jgi:hypothetical protein
MEGHLQEEAAELRQVLQRRTVIEQAKGVLILRYMLDPDAAFAVLRRWSQAWNVKLHRVAGVVVDVAHGVDPLDADLTTVGWWLRQHLVAGARSASLRPPP